MAKVINRGPSPLCLRALVDDKVIEIDLEVGATLVDQDRLMTLLSASKPADDLFALQCELEADEEKPADEGKADFKGGRVADLSKLTLKAAQAAIEACNDPEQLRAWVLTDARPQVKKALHLRDRVLRPAEENPDAKISREISQDV